MNDRKIRVATAILITVISLMAGSCTDKSDPMTLPDAQFARGGNKPPPDPPTSTWDGTQVIAYVESFSEGKSDGDRVAVVASDGSNRAIVFSRLDDVDPVLGEAELAPDGNSVVFKLGDGIYRVSRDPNTSEVSDPELLVTPLATFQWQTLSPDGTKIAWGGIDPAFVGCGPSSVAIDLFVHALDTDQTVRVTSNNDCLNPPSLTTRSPAWISDTEVAAEQSAGSGNSHVVAFDVGTLEDLNQDGVIDQVVTTKSTLGDPNQPQNLWPPLEWIPGTQRGLIMTANPWDFWMIDYAGGAPIWCNITEALDGTVRDPGPGPDDQIVFKMTVSNRSALLTGTLPADCSGDLTGETVVVTQGAGKNSSFPRSPHWKRSGS